MEFGLGLDLYQFFYPLRFLSCLQWIDFVESRHLYLNIRCLTK